jgi:hypothetical protein
MKDNAVRKNFVSRTNSLEPQLKSKPIKLGPKPFAAEPQAVPIGPKLLKKQQKHADNVKVNLQNPKPG